MTQLRRVLQWMNPSVSLDAVSNFGVQMDIKGHINF